MCFNNNNNNKSVFILKSIKTLVTKFFCKSKLKKLQEFKSDSQPFNLYKTAVQ